MKHTRTLDGDGPQPAVTRQPPQVLVWALSVIGVLVGLAMLASMATGIITGSVWTMLLSMWGGVLLFVLWALAVGAVGWVATKLWHGAARLVGSVRR
jgi:tetrahydromethanopterin S-methyltransferase subunit E